MELINKTISLLRRKTVFGRPINFNKEKKTFPKTQEDVKKAFVNNSLNEDALKRHRANNSLFVSLYWDKIFFNDEIKETKFLANEYDGYPFKDNDKTYPTRLHYYYEKGALNPVDKARIKDFEDIDKMKTFFQKIDKVANWDSMKYREKIMRSACEKQIVQNVHLSRRIKKTGDYTNFIYLNFKDGFFGTGADGKGYNRLGAILEDCRRMLTDKENNGFVLLFSAGEWVHPDKGFSGMTESVMNYIAKEFPHNNKGLPDTALNPNVAKSLEDNIFDIFKIISEVNSKDFRENSSQPKKTLKLNLNPHIMKSLINQKEVRVR